MNEMYTPRVGDLLESPSGQLQVFISEVGNKGVRTIRYERKPGRWPWARYWLAEERFPDDLSCRTVDVLVLIASVNHFGWKVIARGPEVKA